MLYESIEKNESSDIREWRCTVYKYTSRDEKNVNNNNYKNYFS